MNKKWNRISKNYRTITKGYRLYSLWDFLGKNAGVGCHFLPPGIFPAQELNAHLHFR